MKIGVNTWVWTSPLTIEEFTRLAAHIKGLGFDLVEVPIESTSDLDYTRAAAVAREHGLAVSVCAAMSPDRDLIHPDESIRANGMAYVRHCIEAAYTLGSNRVCGRCTRRSAGPGRRRRMSARNTWICSSRS